MFCYCSLRHLHYADVDSLRDDNEWNARRGHKIWSKKMRKSGGMSLALSAVEMVDRKFPRHSLHDAFITVSQFRLQLLKFVMEFQR